MHPVKTVKALVVRDADGTTDSVLVVLCRAEKSPDLVGVNAARLQAYNKFADVNGDGVVDANDVNVVRARLGARIPLRGPPWAWPKSSLTSRRLLQPAQSPLP